MSYYYSANKFESEKEFNDILNSDKLGTRFTCRETLLSAYKTFYLKDGAKESFIIIIKTRKDVSTTNYEGFVKTENIELTDSKINSIEWLTNKFRYARFFEKPSFDRTGYSINNKGEIILCGIFFTPEFLSLLLLLFSYNESLLKDSDTMPTPDNFTNAFLEAYIPAFNGIFDQKIFTCYYYYLVYHKQRGIFLPNSCELFDIDTRANGPATSIIKDIYKLSTSFYDFIERHKDVISKNYSKSGNYVSLNKFLKFVEACKDESSYG